MQEEYYLVRPTQSDEKAATELITKWRDFGGRMNPALLRLFNGNYSRWLEHLDNWNKGIGIGEEIPQTFFFLKRIDGTILGATAIRHYLNHSNINDGGHVAYGR